MHLTSLTSFFTIATTLVTAQITQDPTTGAFDCAKSDAVYCAGDSLTTNVIVRCIGKVGVPANCNDNLAGIPPLGVKTFAPCYQSTPTVGDAACSFDGVVYSPHGTFPVPGFTTINCTSAALNTTTSTATVVSALPTLSPSTTGAPYPIPAASNVSGTGAIAPTGTATASNTSSPPFTAGASEAEFVGWGAFLGAFAVVAFL
ncbi:MAG: hypothetical protein Q9217_000106 [Psora testacea]